MASYFWVGGSGTWNGANTANWSATSGGAGGAGPPLAADTVTFDANSGTGTCTTAAGSTCTAATLNSSTLALTLGAAHTMSGTFTHTAGTLSLGTNKLTCQYFFSSSSNVRTIDFGTGDITLTGNGTAIWSTSTSTNLTISGTPVVNCTYAGAVGTRSLNNATSTGKDPSKAVSFNITAGTDTIVLGSTGYFKSINFTGFSGTLSNTSPNIGGDFVVSAGMTLAAGTSAIGFNGPSPLTQKITTSGKTFDFPVQFGNDTPATTTVFEMQDALTLGTTRTLTLVRGTLKLKAGATTTVGTFAVSSTVAKFLQSTTPGTQATLSQASGTVSVSNVTITDINATGGATWQAYTTDNNVDGGNNLGWDFSSQVGKYMYSRRKNKRILP